MQKWIESRGEQTMTDKEIMQALEYCTTNGYCMNCPYNNCTNKDIDELALDLINHQKAEIERLNQRIKIAQSEAIKEFAERLKTRFGEWMGDNKTDDIIKEIVGENNG